MLRLSFLFVALLILSTVLDAAVLKDDFDYIPDRPQDPKGPQDPKEVTSSSSVDPLSPENGEIDILEGNLTDFNGTGKDLFVIKTVVYEIGILTDIGNDTNFDNETHEQIDVSFFDPAHNGSIIDLSQIPIPIQTNVSGVSITGLLPANFGDLNLLKNGTPTVQGSHFPLFPNKQVRVTHNVSTSDRDRTNDVLSGLPELLGLKDFIKYDSSSEESKDQSSGESKDSDESKEKRHKKHKESNYSSESKESKEDDKEKKH
ncbi:uncharacterized protein LOC126890895 [Diabrotica virgifera virgifera]|uniref:Uncharacterized protein n=1 Tax=Diabrotica virgifera virgifera TaxID=50390 RepID=A0ABM5L0P6_DIAVI|nr:uncharacterized protein LOC126890895 [Diabrotica virgifera virgifera]